jgi:ABC-type lipoprotein release transport system permease subunit
VPALAIALIGAGAIVLANLAAALPAWLAAKTPTALMLRAE